jgi:hypothetical protein
VAPSLMTRRCAGASGFLPRERLRPRRRVRAREGSLACHLNDVLLACGPRFQRCVPLAPARGLCACGVRARHAWAPAPHRRRGPDRRTSPPVCRRRRPASSRAKSRAT